MAGMTTTSILGPLEGDIMEVMWEQCPCSVRDVHAAVSKERPLAYTTVMTVMSRLVEKGILCKNTDDKAHMYQVCISRQEVARVSAQKFLHALFEIYQDDGLKAFQEAVQQLPPEKQALLQNAVLAPDKNLDLNIDKTGQS